MSTAAKPAATPAAEAPKPKPKPRPRVKIPAHIEATHPTAGLPGYPARDLFGPAGADVVIEFDAAVVRFSGKEPTPKVAPGGAYGWSMYLDGGKGRYYITHLGTRAVKVGDVLKAGTVLGTLADFKKATGGVTDCHAHVGLHRR